jgi:hypothetical protein
MELFGRKWHATCHLSVLERVEVGKVSHLSAGDMKIFAVLIFVQAAIFKVL